MKIVNTDEPTMHQFTISPHPKAVEYDTVQLFNERFTSKGEGETMTEAYSVVAAFGTNADAESAVQKLERNGVQKSMMSIENRVTPILQRPPSSYHADAGTTSWAITGGLLGGFWWFLTNGERFQHDKSVALSVEPFLSCLGFIVKGACVSTIVNFINFNMTDEILRLQLTSSEPGGSTDSYLLIVHGTPAAIALAGNTLRAA